MFFVVENIDLASHAALFITQVINVFLLRESSKKHFKQFTDNLMKSNIDRCHLIVCTNDSVEIQKEDF